eukprot:2099677-Rhodomonas_salina.3
MQACCLFKFLKRTEPNGSPPGPQHTAQPPAKISAASGREEERDRAEGVPSACNVSRQGSQMSTKF